MVALYAFTCGFVTMPLRSFFADADKSPFRVPVPAYLIEHAKGLAVFDTGLGVPAYQAMNAMKGVAAEFDALADVGARLRAAGFDPADVRFIVNSHLHSDHSGGNAALPNATVVVQAPELEAAKDGGAAYEGGVFDAGHPVLKLSGEHDLFGDGSVTLFPTPGHTPGHQCARVLLESGPVVLAGDCCYMRRTLDEFALPRITADPETHLKSIKLLRSMRERGDRIFYGHDPEQWATMPQGKAMR
jgi:glyoxylase-like metal-dependent hydrolase (beta-lactamase superfamily II)